MTDDSANADTPTETELRISRRWPVISGGIAIVLTLLLAVLVVVRQNLLPFEFDEEWAEELVEDRLPALEWLSLAMNALGGGIVGVFIVPIGAAVVLLIVRRPWSAFYFIVASALSAGAVQLLKGTIGRPRPEDMLVTSDFGSFPSGHAANAATIAVAIGIIFPRLWVWIAGLAYVALMAYSRTYLGVHWLSDTIGGALLGIGVALIVWAPFAAALRSEPRPHRERSDSA
ncbi:hypothetical protein GCM10027416_17110 [Okibacterium endophyticum]